MARSAYIGVRSETPEYEEITIDITKDNHTEYLSIAARDDNSDEMNFYFFWDNNQIINTPCSSGAWADMDFYAECDIEKFSVQLTGCGGYKYFFGNEGEEQYVPEDDYLLEGKLNKGESVFFMFQYCPYLEQGDIVFSNIRVTIKVPKTNSTTINITPDNIDEYFVDLSNFYIGADSSTNHPFYWQNGKIVSAPIE